MNISNNINSTNVSNLIASSISKLNLSSVKKPNLEQNTESILNENIKEEEKVNENLIIPDNKTSKKVDVDDIQKYAKIVGQDVTVDDINYGIMYGRSVIADYIA